MKMERVGDVAQRSSTLGPIPGTKTRKRLEAGSFPAPGDRHPAGHRCQVQHRLDGVCVCVCCVCAGVHARALWGERKQVRSGRGRCPRPHPGLLGSRRHRALRGVLKGARSPSRQLRAPGGPGGPGGGQGPSSTTAATSCQSRPRERVGVRGGRRVRLLARSSWAGTGGGRVAGSVLPLSEDLPARWTPVTWGGQRGPAHFPWSLCGGQAARAQVPTGAPPGLWLLCLVSKCHLSLSPPCSLGPGSPPGGAGCSWRPSGAVACQALRRRRALSRAGPGPCPVPGLWGPEDLLPRTEL